jgi:hypothetical protein
MVVMEQAVLHWLSHKREERGGKERRERREREKREERGGKERRERRKKGRVMVKLGPVTPIGLTRLVATQRKVDGLSVVPQQLARLSHVVPLGATDAYVAPHRHASTRQPSESPPVTPTHMA